MYCRAICLAAALAFSTTMLAPAGTLVGWTILDIARTGKPTAVGAATARWVAAAKLVFHTSMAAP